MSFLSLIIPYNEICFTLCMCKKCLFLIWVLPLFGIHVEHTADAHAHWPVVFLWYFPLSGFSVSYRRLLCSVLKLSNWNNLAGRNIRAIFSSIVEQNSCELGFQVASMQNQQVLRLLMTNEKCLWKHSYMLLHVWSSLNLWVFQHFWQSLLKELYAWSDIFC